MNRALSFVAAAVVALASVALCLPSAARGQTVSLPSFEEAIHHNASAIEPVAGADAERAIRLARHSIELASAAARLAPRQIDTDSPRLAATRFGWIGVHFPIRSTPSADSGVYALWYDRQTWNVVAEAVFVPQRTAVQAHIALAGQVILDESIPLVSFDGERFWDCLRACTDGALSHWLYTLVRAVCSRACVPVSVYCAPCVIALSALEAGMISGCVYDCSRRQPGSGAWAISPPPGHGPLAVWRYPEPAFER